MPIKNRFAETHAEITAWRRHLHQHPELMFDLPETSRFVEEKLRSFGITDITTGIAQTGVVAVIEGQSNSSGRTIGLRADMDALPITEATGLPHASKHPGKMHACGHDGHTAMLLGAAQYLVETRNFDGRVVLIFQPAEEGGGGGNVMVQEGLMDRWGIDEVYGMHNMPGHPTGQFAIREGALLAAADEFAITLTGQGGHAAAPHEAVDTNLAAAHVMIALQSIASRNTDPLKQVVVSVCTLRSDTDSHNVLPHKVLLRGTVRTLDPEVQDLAERRLHDLTRLTAEAHQCRAEIDYQRGYPVTRNHADQTRFAAEAADKVTPGTDRDTPPIMAGEDFSYMLNARPGAYIMIGNGEGATVHHPEYDFDDAAIPAGCSWFAQVVEDRLARA
ncbi:MULTISPECIES: M20 aminoacylase family protein [unclassified Sulfitobacter]|uniref:M20 aminoacylase family protein n=1 Tax=unclassified Sulfitobacter TaxID=196795 RepID=UPI0023E348BA|nr:MULTISPECIES: M20 aminoacylase family protein [unclassified Sulfitobacter]MDF3383796.1 amidohydrolase [Sulfitobacter sp. Ks11]MDF3387214.1 amidohydrolase [Sulfitobacter sp. M85]MDF3390634.1 amidohydrolase [Sulfitobacter sp. Ks16]MDF3401271.1 amidohydrolase [Sulfitobacter sp. KE39]MDF3404692.1 amidohydrolase [Sulfitobacter sp. Ks35]